MSVPFSSNPGPRWMSGNLSQRPPAKSAHSGDTFFAVDGPTSYTASNGAWISQAAQASSTVSVDNATQLLSVDHKQFPNVLMLGRLSPYDGGGGAVAWTADTTSPADGGTIFVPAGTRVGCWKRLEALGGLSPSPVTVKWFGVAGDGVTDDTVGFQNWLAYLASIQQATPLGVFIASGHGYIPRGNYAISATLSQPSHTVIFGEYQQTWLLFTANSALSGDADTFRGDGWIMCNSPGSSASGSSQLKRVCLANHAVHNDSATIGGITLLGGSQCLVQEVIVAGWPNGILMAGHELSFFEKCALGGLSASAGVPDASSIGVRMTSGIRGISVLDENNIIAIDGCNFNSPAIGISHEGPGVTQSVRDCNFESPVRIANIAGVQNVSYQNCTTGDPGTGDLFFFGSDAGPGLSCIGFTLRGGWYHTTGAIIDIHAGNTLGELSWDNPVVANCDVTGAIRNAARVTGTVFINTGYLAPSGVLADGPFAAKGAIVSTDNGAGINSPSPNAVLDVTTYHTAANGLRVGGIIGNEFSVDPDGKRLTLNTSTRNGWEVLTAKTEIGPGAIGIPAMLAVPLDTSECWEAEISIVARDTDALGCAAWRFIVLANRMLGNSAEISQVALTVPAPTRGDIPVPTISLHADKSSVDIFPTSVANHTLDWAVQVSRIIRG